MDSQEEVTVGENGLPPPGGWLNRNVFGMGLLQRLPGLNRPWLICNNSGNVWHCETGVDNILGGDRIGAAMGFALKREVMTRPSRLHDNRC